MHKVCDYNFQIHRHNGKRALPRRELALFGGLQLGQLATQLNDILDSVVTYPNIKTLFSLICVEHQNGNSSGWSQVNFAMPGTVLRFHFMLDRNLVEFGQPILQHGYKSNGTVKQRKLVRQHVAFLELSDVLGGGKVLSVGLSAKDLDSNYEELGRTLDELALIYKIMGITTKAHKLYAGNFYKPSEYIGSVLANNSPSDYHKCVMLWKRYPNLIYDISVTDAEYILENIQKYRKLYDTGNRIISQEQRALLGVSTNSSYDKGILHWLYLAVRATYFEDTSLPNRCLEICFANFLVSASSVEELAKELWSIDKATVIHKLHKLIWSEK